MTHRRPRALWDAPRGHTLVEVVSMPAAGFPDETALYLSTDGRIFEPLTWAALWRDACRLAHRVSSPALRPGQPVLLVAPTSAAFVTSFFGILAAGGVPVPVAPPASVRPARLEWYRSHLTSIAEDSGARAVVTTTRYREALQAWAEGLPWRLEVLDAESAEAGPDTPPALPPHPGALALLQYTSGSTSRPKGVALTHANVVANMALIAEAIVHEHSAGVSWLPLYHDMGLIGALLSALYSRTPLLLMPTALFIKEPASWLRAIAGFGGTITLAPNFAFGHVTRHAAPEALAGVSLAGLETVLNGAEPIDSAAIAAFEKTFAGLGLPPGVVRPVYGLAESALAVTFADRGAPIVDVVDADALERDGRAVPAAPGARTRRFVAVGRPLRTQEVRIVGPDDCPCPERTVGEIVVRGPSVMQGYYGRPAETREALRGGWLHTGDLGYFADGRLLLTSRLKDLIIRRGRNYYPADIERVVGATDGVLRGGAAAFGLDAGGGERVVIVAETKLRDAEALAALQRAIRERCHDAFLFGPDDVRLVAAGGIPRTTSGKVRRRECRQQYLAAGLPIVSEGWGARPPDE
ncbi:MAG: fatty acyl-AMP ligase [Acidobacteriota bacterium]